MELNLERKTLKLNYDGNSHNLTYPSGRIADKFAKLIKDSSDDQKMDVVEEFLASLGLPKEVSSTLSAENLQLIIEELSGKKK